MALDLTAFGNSITRLEEGLTRHDADPGDTQIRDGLIQRFEFTYEIAHKTLKRFLEQGAATPEEFDSADFQYLIRSANEQGLLRGDWAAWRGYRAMRAKTSHSYSEAVALEVVAGIRPFLEEVRFLRDRLAERQKR